MTSGKETNLLFTSKVFYGTNNKYVKKINYSVFLYFADSAYLYLATYTKRLAKKKIRNKDTKKSCSFYK